MPTPIPEVSASPESFTSSTAHMFFRFASNTLKKETSAAPHETAPLLHKVIIGNDATVIPLEKIARIEKTLDDSNAALDKLRTALTEAKTPSALKQALNAPVTDATTSMLQTAVIRKKLKALIEEHQHRALTREKNIKAAFATLKTDPTAKEQVKKIMATADQAVAETHNAVISAVELFEKEAQKTLAAYEILRAKIPVNAATDPLALPSIEQLNQQHSQGMRS